jgi:hypothetical protein
VQLGAAPAAVVVLEGLGFGGDVVGRQAEVGEDPLPPPGAGAATTPGRTPSTPSSPRRRAVSSGSIAVTPYCSIARRRGRSAASTRPPSARCRRRASMPRRQSARGIAASWPASGPRAAAAPGPCSSPPPTRRSRRPASGGTRGRCARGDTASGHSSTHAPNTYSMIWR